MSFASHEEIGGETPQVNYTKCLPNAVMNARRYNKPIMPTMTDKRPSLRDRAAQTFADIERVYSLGNGDYRDKAGNNYPSFAWGHGVLASAFVAACDTMDKKKYEPLLKAQLNALNRGYFRTDGPVPGYNASRTQTGRTDRYYDDNAWLALAYADAFHLTGDVIYQEAAQKAYDFALSGHEKQKGVFWHENELKSQNTCSTAPTAVYVLETARDTPRARQLYSWLYATLRDPADGLYWDDIAFPSGKIGKAKWSYNSALVLRLETSMAQVWRTPEYLRRADALADACVKHWYKPDMQILSDDAAFSHLLCENLLRTAKITGNKAATRTALMSLDTLWTQVRRPDGTYPKHWRVSSDKADKSAEILPIASAARAYAFAAAYGG